MNFTVEEYLDLLKGADQVTGSKLYRMGEAEVSGITYESEKAGPGSLFIWKKRFPGAASAMSAKGIMAWSRYRVSL